MMKWQSETGTCFTAIAEHVLTEALSPPPPRLPLPETVGLRKLASRVWECGVADE